MRGCRSAGWAKLDAGPAEFPAQGGRVDAEIVAQARHRFACQVPTCGPCEKLIGEFADSRSTRDTPSLEVS